MSQGSTRNLRSNSTAPNIWPIQNNPASTVTMATAPVEIWNENPCQENFNPGTANGQKMFTQLSRGNPDGRLYSLQLKDAEEFNINLKARAPTFGTCINRIPAEFDATGNPTRFVSIPDQYQSIQIETLQRAAFKRYSTELQPGAPIPPQPWNSRILDPANVPADKEIFYDRVRSNVVTEWLSNTMDPSALAALTLEKAKFTFVDANGIEKQDGPTKLFILLKTLDPSTAINIENHRRQIETCKLQKFNNKVTDMVIYLETHHKIILDNGGQYDETTFRRHCLDALLSGSNAKFNAHFEMIKGEVQSGQGYNANITSKQLLSSAQTFYNNLDSMDEWTKVDPNEARIMALQTELKQVKTEYAALTTQQKQGGGGAPRGSTANQSSDSSPFIPGTQVREWRAKFKGATIEYQGQTYHWCGEHKNPPLWDGLYYKDHTPATHDKWRAERTESNKKAKAAKASSANANTSAQQSSNSSGTKKDLTISSKLRTALASNLCISEEDIKRIEASLESGN